MSIARQRREAAAGLAILMEEKNEALKLAVDARDDERTQHAALEMALLTQNNAAFLIYVLKAFAGTMMKLPGGGKPSNKEVPVHHESLAEAAASDMDLEAEARAAKKH